jgi:erythromycin esterase
LGEQFRYCPKPESLQNHFAGATKEETTLKNLMPLCLCLFLPFNLFAQIISDIGGRATAIYPLSVDRETISGQLAPLKVLLSSRSVVGMGEATHGTREFFEIKSGVFQWLVEECNFRVFGIEATGGGCCYINDFVQSGAGNIDSVMVFLDFWTWQTEEVRDLILWIKDYNSQAVHVEKVSFYGFDMQNFYVPVQYFTDFVKIHFPAEYHTVKDISLPVLGKTERQIYQLLDQKSNRFEDTLRQTHQLLAAWLIQHKTYIENSQQSKQYGYLSYCLDNLGQAVKYLSVENVSKFRDSCMAYNVLQIQKMTNEKIFVWAHNGHVNIAYPDNKSVLMGLQMGGHLKKQLGAGYYTIGFVFNQGSFQAVQGPRSIGGAIFKYLFARKKMYQGLKICTVPVYTKNTFTQALSGTGYPVYFVDLTQADNPVFSTLLKTYDLGAIFMNYKRSAVPIHAKRQFDGLIYVEKTSSARPVFLRKKKPG